MPSCSQRHQSVVLPSEPLTFVRNVRSCVTCKCFMCQTLSSDFTGGKKQSSPGCGRTRGGAKLWSKHVVFGIPWEKGMPFLPVFTCFILNGLIGFLLRVQREEMKAKIYNCFRLLSLSSSTALGLGTAGSQPDLQPDFPSALCCRFIYASAF